MHEFLDSIGRENPSREEIEDAEDVILAAVAHVGTSILAGTASTADKLAQFNEAIAWGPGLVWRAWMTGWRHPCIRIEHRFFAHPTETRH